MNMIKQHHIDKANENIRFAMQSQQKKIIIILTSLESLDAINYVFGAFIKS